MSNQEAQAYGVMQMTCAMILAGTIGFFVSKTGLPIVNVVFWRCILGGVFLSIYCYFYGGWLKGVTLANIKLLILASICLTVNWLLLFKSFDYAPISVSTVVYNTQPVILIVLAYFLFGEPLFQRRSLLLLSALVGVLLISFGDNIFDHNQDDFSSLYLGIALAFVAAIFYALITLLTRRVEGMSPALIAFFQVNIGSFLLLPFVDSTKIITESGLIYVIVLGVVHTGVMYILLYGAVRKITIYSIAAISFFYPITALIIDLLVFGVEFTSLQYLGLVLVMCSSVSVSLIESKRII